MKRTLLVLCICILGLEARAQAPKPAEPFPAIDKVDKIYCEQIKIAPLICTEGPAGEACKTVKIYTDKTCPTILSSWSWGSIVPWDKIIEGTSLIIAALFALLVTATVGWVSAYRAKIEARERVEKLSNRVFDPMFPRPDGYENLATNMILVGEGGSGKTTIIHALSGANEAKPDVATAGGAKTYTLVNEVNIQGRQGAVRRLVRIYTDDYEGQDWTNILNFDGLKQRQKIISSSTLVIVVDLVRLKDDIIDPQPTIAEPDQTRISYQNNAYGDNVLLALKQLVGPEGQIILFINKIDAINPLTSEGIKSAKKCYEGLIERLQQLRDVELRVVVGSAKTGWGLTGWDEGNTTNRSLLKFVIDHAVKVTADHKWKV